MGKFACMGLLACAATLGHAAAFAPSTVGELLDAGGQRLGPREVKALLSGATFTGVSRFGVSFEIHSRANGRYTGVAGPRRERLTGRWWVDDEGLYCTQVASGAHRGETSCSAWFGKGHDYFASDADAARDAPLRVRHVRRDSPVRPPSRL
jgi:hypothetical protein